MYLTIFRKYCKIHRYEGEITERKWDMHLKELLGWLEIKLYAFDRITCEKWWNYPRISSPFTRLFYTLEGKALVRHGGREFELRPGRLIITPPFIPVDYICHGRFENFYAIFTCRTLNGLDIFAMGEFDYEMDGDSLTPLIFEKIKELNPDRSLKLLDPFKREYNSSIWNSSPDALPVESVLGTDGLLRFLISPFFRTFRFKEGNRESPLKNRFFPLLQFIESKLEAKLSLDDLAARAGLHPAYFSDCFTREIGMRPMQWLARKRIEKAQFLLHTTDMELKEIAEICGFNDTNYFFKVFKKMTGITPGKYRQDVPKTAPTPVQAN